MHSDAHDEHEYSEKRMHSLKKAACLCRLEDFLTNHKAHSGLKPYEIQGHSGAFGHIRHFRESLPLVFCMGILRDSCPVRGTFSACTSALYNIKKDFDAGSTGVEPVSGPEPGLASEQESGLRQCVRIKRSRILTTSPAFNLEAWPLTAERLHMR